MTEWTGETFTSDAGWNHQETLVDVGYGLPEDFDRDLEDEIVVAASNAPDWYDRFLHRREKHYHTVEAGAAAFVFRNHVEGCLAPTGSVGTEDHPIETTPRLNPHSDHWPYVQWGVPGVHVIAETDYEGRGWGHTRADTLDKLEVRNLREQAVLLTGLVVQLASEGRQSTTGPQRVSRASSRTRISPKGCRSSATGRTRKAPVPSERVPNDRPYHL